MRLVLTILAVIVGTLLVFVAFLWVLVSMQLIPDLSIAPAVTTGSDATMPTATAASVTPTSSALERGQSIFQEYGCQGCHTGENTIVAPTLSGLFGTEVRLDDGSVVLADSDYLYESITDPEAKLVDGYIDIMPKYYGDFDESMIFDLVTYIRSLAKQ